MKAQKIIFASFVAAIATACTNAVPVPVQPRLDLYSQAFQDRALDETLHLPPPCARDVVTDDCSAINRLILDYLALRDRIRGNAL